MTDKPLATAPARPSAFLPAEPARDAHIVDVLIEERCPSFAEHWTWPVVRPVLYNMLGYASARRLADYLKTLSGVDSFQYMKERLDIRLRVDHPERLPERGRVIVAANHPTGLADGVAVWDALTRIRKDVVFFANADALRVNRLFEECLIPVEWVTDKRTPAKTRETLRRAGEAFAEEKCVVIFPSGKLAKMVDGKLTEQDWFSTVVSLARKQKAAIAPLHVSAKNSRLYYTLANLNAELRDITLFHELLNKRRSKFDMAFGPLIPPEKLQGDSIAVTEQLKNYVAYDLLDDPHKPFEPDLD
ncbi:MAG: 1-acyl-sn-glycerol-3-phosphate acyltransferase [Pseudomonadota bacterium]